MCFKILTCLLFLIAATSCIKRNALLKQVINHQKKQLAASIKEYNHDYKIDTSAVHKQFKKLTRKALKNKIRDSFFLTNFYNLYTPQGRHKKAATDFSAIFISNGDTISYWIYKNRVFKEKLSPLVEDYKVHKANIDSLAKQKPMPSCFDCRHYQYLVQYINIKKDSIAISGYHIVTTY